MPLPRFYLPHPLRAQERIALPDAIVRHVHHARRLRAGDEVVLFNGTGGEYIAQLEHDNGCWSAAVHCHHAIEREASLDIVLLQALPMGDRMDWILQKATELGVRHIAPIETQRCVRRLTGERARRQQQHWQGIVQAACEQCGRNVIPTIAALQSFPAAIEQLPIESTRLLLYPQGAYNFKELPSALPTPVVIAIGPEGDWDPNELILATQKKFLPLRLGGRILRTDTAAIATISALLARWGDFQ